MAPMWSLVMLLAAHSHSMRNRNARNGYRFGNASNCSGSFPYPDCNKAGPKWGTGDHGSRICAHSPGSVPAYFLPLVWRNTTAFCSVDPSSRFTTVGMGMPCFLRTTFGGV